MHKMWIKVGVSQDWSVFGMCSQFLRGMLACPLVCHVPIAQRPHMSWTDQNQDVVSADENQVPVVDQTIVPETDEGDHFQMQVSDEILTETGLGDWTSETEVEEVSLASTWVFGESGSILDISSMELAPPPDEHTLGETADQANPQE